MTTLRPAPAASDRFMWVPDKRMYVTEISDIGGRFGRVFDDACDEGLTLVSSKHAGQEIVFAVEHTEMGEGEILWWDLHPANLKDKACGFTLRVFND